MMMKVAELQWMAAVVDGSGHSVLLSAHGSTSSNFTSGHFVSPFCKTSAPASETIRKKTSRTQKETRTPTRDTARHHRAKKKGPGRRDAGPGASRHGLSLG